MRREVDLEIARVDDDAGRRFNRQRHAVHQRVRHADGLNDERADGELLARFNLDQVDLVQQLVLVQLAFHVGQRELGRVDRNLQLGENPGQPADVIFMAVCEHYSSHARPVFS
jgi:hypothetical protein